MSVLIYINAAEGKVKKNDLETISYANSLSKNLEETLVGVVVGNENADLSTLGKYGLKTIFQIESAETLSDIQLIKTLEKIITENSVSTIIFSRNNLANNIAGKLAAQLKAGIVTNVVSLPNLSEGFVVKKAVYSGKAFAKIKINSSLKVITLNPNICEVQEISDEKAVVEKIQPVAISEKITLIKQNKNPEKTPLNEAEIVVAGGLGLKGAENWHLISDLANVLNAAQACSRPVSDNGWRPHEEHVGQTGTQIAPNLYVAVGISGAIQHLGGVNQSKFIAAINQDADAPIFKVADFGMVGDLFEIMPKLIEEIKNPQS